MEEQSLLSFLKNGDFELARKRILDFIYDCNDFDLMRKSIIWSKNCKLEDQIPPTTEWIAEGGKLIEFANKVQNTHKLPKVLLKVNNISKKYSHGKFALTNINFEISSGEIIGIVGENGNGKTTFLRQVSGELQKDSGTIEYFYTKPSVNYYYDIKNSTGFIPQRIPKWWGVLRQNLEFTASSHGIVGEKNTLMVDFVLERFGLTKFENLYWTQISSGYRTRFEIARIMLLRPDMLILDEPLANLDINAQQTLLQDLKHIAKSKYKPIGIILTSQQLFEVEKVADKILFLQNGKGKYNTELANLSQNTQVIEIETSWNKDNLLTALGANCKSIKFNGGIYEIEFEGENNQLISLLSQQKIEFNYYRNITKSTKRFFTN